MQAKTLHFKANSDADVMDSRPKSIPNRRNNGDFQFSRCPFSALRAAFRRSQTAFIRTASGSQITAQKLECTCGRGRPRPAFDFAFSEKFEELSLLHESTKLREYRQR
jgi:hypothetical protein